MITVSDNGIGFEQVYAEKIFQLFQRLQGKFEFPGSGIGLSICKKIVSNHNGQIFASAEPGKEASSL
jgi:signal transduction histidine kinase